MLCWCAVKKLLTLEQLALFWHLGTISFGEFSSVLDQSVPVRNAESGRSEAAPVDVIDASLTQSSAHSLTAGLFCIFFLFMCEFVVLLVAAVAVSMIPFSKQWLCRNTYWLLERNDYILNPTEKI